MENHINRKQLLESFQSLQNQFDKSLVAAKKHERDFELQRQTFMQRLSAHLADARKSLPDGNPLKRQVLGFIDLMDKTKAEWNMKIAGREKGVKFREGFGDSLLVFVNGKVKSGKSSLGNYMAWGHTDPDDNLKQRVTTNIAPIYFSHEKADVQGGDTENEAQRRREFRVGATEATSSIQGFKLPGLTWVDSPGLHSLNKENERLAREYVEHADLILYTMKSDSPGRDSDITEITQLFSKEKKTLLLLTGSDDIDEDYDDEADCLVQKVVMKDPQRRQKQRTYVRDALMEKCGEDNARNVEVISLSARYAQLNADDPVAFSESGMEQLCETLHRIAQSDGVHIKQRTPIANLRSFLKSCHGDLQPYSDLVSGFKQPLRELKHASDGKLNAHVRDGQTELSRYIDSFFDQLSSHRDDESEVGKQLAVFQKTLDEKFKEITSDKLDQIFEEITVGFKNTVAQVYSSSDLFKLPDFRLETVEEQIPVVRSGTKKRNSAVGSIVGGLFGLAVGGPAGAALGAAIGGGLGGATGDSASVNHRSITITVGDNLQDIRQQVIRNSEKMFEEQMRKSAGLLWSAMNEDVERLLSNLRREIADFESRLDRMLRATENA